MPLFLCLSSHQMTDRLFNNADSFAMVFDEAWKTMTISQNSSLSKDERMALVMESVADHPFLVAQPEMAQQVAEFRLRLLDLT